MKRVPYWIQRADFSSTDYEPVDVERAIDAWLCKRTSAV